MRCKHGDLAIIVGDFPGCEGNLGIIVKVIGPPELHHPVQMVCWSIYPIKRRKLWLVDEAWISKEPVSKHNTALHPDCWLLPIYGNEPQSADKLDLTLDLQVALCE